jgi:hypothetical protein
MNEIRTILKEARFSDLLGIAESYNFECKSQPYDLQQPKQQHELAKDVSALANSEGGLIIVGLKTKKDLTQRLDIVDKIRPFDKSLFNQEKLLSTIEQFVFPYIQNLQIEWHDFLQEEGKGIFSIFVPTQEKSPKPYLVTRLIDSDDNVYGNVVGIFERRRDTVSHRTPQGIHSLLSFAENTYEITDRLDSIESLLREKNFLDKKQSEKEFLEKIDSIIRDRVIECADAAELRGSPFLSIACFPSHHVDIPALFRGHDDPVVKLINYPPRYRDSGWDLNTFKPSKSINGLLRRSVEPGVLSLDAWRDGIIIVVASANKNYLSWGRYAYDNDIPAINPVALIEVISIFSKLAKSILKAAEPPALTANFRLSFSNISQNGKNYKLKNNNIFGFSKEAPSSSVVIDVPAQKLDRQDDEIAFNIFCSIFEWFGIDHDKIPLIKKTEDGNYVLDEENIKNLQG